MVSGIDVALRSAFVKHVIPASWAAFRPAAESDVSHKPGSVVSKGISTGKHMRSDMVRHGQDNVLREPALCLFIYVIPYEQLSGFRCPQYQILCFDFRGGLGQPADKVSVSLGPREVMAPLRFRGL